MAIRRYQAEDAVNKEKGRGVEKRGDGPALNIPLTLLLMRRIAGLYRENRREGKRCSLEELMRLALDEFEIREEDQRENYRAAMGFYFGPRGNLAQERLREAGISVEPHPLHDPTDCVIVGESGQSRWLW